MKRAFPLIFITSFASSLIERGVYFLTRHVLHYSDALNLWLALLYGALYILGAAISHGLAKRYGERRMLAASLAGHVVVLAAITSHCTTTTAFVGTGLVAFLNGIKWPILESYVSAGLTPAESVRAVGKFSLAWSSAVPVSLGVTGTLIEWWSTSPFALAGFINLATLLVVLRFPERPTHLPDDHPERPDANALRRETGLLHFSRWVMLLSYIAMWVITPLAPRIFEDLRVSTASATILASTVDWARLAAFALLMFGGWWRGSIVVIALSFVTVVAGFFVTVLAPSVAITVAGLVATGLAAGLVYYAALSYAMIVKNASVEAGGGHEGFIGAGFLIGPLAGLAGTAATGALASTALGMLVGVGPYILICGGVGVALMVRTLRQRR